MSGAVDPHVRAPLSSLRAGLGRRCPRCGEGRLYAAYLKVAKRCSVCGLNLAGHDAGDGPAVLVSLITGFVVVGAALLVEVRFTPPYWLHMVLWAPSILALSLGLLPVTKAWLIAQHYRHDLLEERNRPRH